MKQLKQLLHHFISKFYYCKAFFIEFSLQIFKEMIEFQNSIQDWVFAIEYRKNPAIWLA